jgi:hypothetical protein
MRITSRKLAALAMVAIVLTLGACAGTQTTSSVEEKSAPTPTPPPQASVVTAQQAKPLDTAYSDILVNDLKTTDTIKNDYPAALSDLESSLTAQLRSKKAYARVVHNPGGAALENTLLVNLNVPEIRIPSSGARFWGGPFAGSAYMTVELELVDALSGKTLRRESFSSANSSMAATWNFGASDRSLPSDMGVIVAEYIFTVVPAIK